MTKRIETACTTLGKGNAHKTKMPGVVESCARHKEQQYMTLRAEKSLKLIEGDELGSEIADIRMQALDSRLKPMIDAIRRVINPMHNRIASNEPTAVDNLDALFDD